MDVSIVLANDEPCYVDYGGPWPTSELETQAVVSFILERKETIAAFLTIHSYGQLIMTRWAYTDQLYPPDHNETVRYLDCQLSVAHNYIAITLQRKSFLKGLSSFISEIQ